jgi:GT2 family glycosyltransferase
MKITAVVVTYNRVNLLKKLIDRLLNQSIRLTNIVIVNNCSGDATFDFLSKINDERFIISNLDSNLGSAGGFEHGLIKAYNTQSSFIWILDDDGMPEHNALENLIFHLRDGYFHYAACNLVTPDGLQLFDDQISKNKKLNIINCPGGPFNGILITRTLLYEVGVPMNRFFIWGEEMEYINRIRESGFITFTVKSAILVHKSTAIDYKTNNRLKLYVRNLIYQFRLKNHSFNQRIVKFIALCLRIFIIFFKVIIAGRIKIIPSLIASFVKGFLTTGLKIEQQNAKNIFK